MADFRKSLAVRDLEARSLPAVYTVANLNDGGTGSLRQAVLDANANSGADTINFAPQVKGSILHLTSGQLTVTDALTIAGAEPQYLDIDGSYQGRVIVSNASLTLSNINFD